MLRKKEKASSTKLIVSSLMAVPVIMFILTLVNVVWNSVPAVTKYGLPVLFSTKFSSVFSGTYVPGQYGLLPALWGSILLAGSAMLLALPVAIAMAVFASEFSLNGIGGVMELLMSIFSGIPPILYSLLSIFVLVNFVRPKLTGQGFSEDYLMSLMGEVTLKTGGVPSDKSTLLGAIFLALLIIPFMFPLILDAIRNVPAGLKEASFGLGATRWYTLWRITLPAAMPGIMAAISLGILKSIGDVVISAWTVGYIRNGMPTPLFDIFESIAPLTSTGAGLINGLQPGMAGQTANSLMPVAFFTALLLMLLAFAILGLVNLAQHFLVRRIEQ
jgi:ABC-type phosphate transport system permease subunit